MNQVILIGRLVQDPTAQYTNNGTAFTKNSIAVQRNYKNANGEYDTDFLNIVAYRTQAELIVKHFNKGDRIGVTGSIQVDKWTDQSGQNRYTTNIIVEKVEFLQDKKEPTPAPSEAQREDVDFDISEDDLPF